MVDLQANSSASLPRPATPLERRLEAEWRLLERLAAANPGRLTSLRLRDTAFHLELRHTPALPLPRADGSTPALVTDHALRLSFGEFFPAAPMELYLDTPMQHPNLHPETGFVCLWDRHRVTHTVEHALHKIVAILGWRLSNAQAVHVMQPSALARLQAEGDAIQQRLAAPGLQALVPTAASLPQPATPAWRRRLS